LERYADGLVNQKTFAAASKAASTAADSARNAWEDQNPGLSFREEPDNRMLDVVQNMFWKDVNKASSVHAVCKDTQHAGVSPALQAALIRDVCGSPFQHAQTLTSIDPHESGSCFVTARQIGWAAYDNRILPAGLLDPDRLLVLADALEDAGCTEAIILEHLRGPGPHYRGCFVIDALLGKE
jgi:hypothetical protein